jgi:hypothetical protein
MWVFFYEHLVQYTFLYEKHQIYQNKKKLSRNLDSKKHFEMNFKLTKKLRE